MLFAGLLGLQFALFIRERVSLGASGALLATCGILSELLTNWSLYEKKFHC